MNSRIRVANFCVAKLKISRGVFCFGIWTFHCWILFTDFLQGSVFCREILRHRHKNMVTRSAPWLYRSGEVSSPQWPSGVMCKIERINPAVLFSWEFCENGNDSVHKCSLGTRNYYTDGETADSLTFKVSSHFRALDPYLELVYSISKFIRVLVLYMQRVNQNIFTQISHLNPS